MNDALERLRKVLDFEPVLQHDPRDRFERYYPSVVSRLSGNLVIGDALPAASFGSADPLGTLDVGAAGSAHMTLDAEPLPDVGTESLGEPIDPDGSLEPGLGEEPTVDLDLAEGLEGMDLGEATLAPVEAPLHESAGERLVASEEPWPEVGVASQPVPVEPEEVEFVPFTSDGIPAPVRPYMLEFIHLRTDSWIAAPAEPGTLAPAGGPGEGGGGLGGDVGGDPSGAAAAEEPLVVAELEPDALGPGAALVDGDARPPATARAVAGAEDAPLVVDGYTLYAKRAALRGGERTIHFFAREAPEGAVAVALPPDREVRRNPRSRLPYLRRARTAEERTSKKTRKSVRPSKKGTKRNG